MEGSELALSTRRTIGGDELAVVLLVWFGDVGALFEEEACDSKTTA
jgi:hypothetical protein